MKPGQPSIVNSLNDFLKGFLSDLLQGNQVQRAEILLLNRHDDMVPVASADFFGPQGKGKTEIRVQSRIIDSKFTHTLRRMTFPGLKMPFLLPLFESGELLGYLHLHPSDCIALNKDHMKKFQVLVPPLASKIRHHVLKARLEDMKKEMQHLEATHSDTLQRITSLSKELYAITAISTKINQSMSLGKTLRKAMAKIREVFGASSVHVYVRGETSCNLEFLAMNTEDPDTECRFSKKTEKELFRNIGTVRKPFVWDKSSVSHQSGLHGPGTLPSEAIIFTPLRSQHGVIGALILVRKSEETFNRDSIRLLSGIANILGMAIANMKLYRQLQQKKRESDFLLHSVSKFNENLGLTETLKSVAEKTAAFFGRPCQVYILSKTKVPMIQVTYKQRGAARSPTSQILKKIQPEGLKGLYRLIKPRRRSFIVNDIARSRKMSEEMKSFFLQRGVRSLLAVHLKIGKKVVGLLLLCRFAEKELFQRRDIAVANALAAAGSVAIQNAQTYTASLELSGFLERKITEKSSQLQNLQEREKARVEHEVGIVFRVDRRNRFIFVNQAVEKLTGYSREELCRGDIRAEDIVDEKDRGRVRDCFRRILSGELPMVKDLEYRSVCKKNLDLFISLTAYPEKDPSGRIVGLEGVGQDISARKRLEAELKRAKDLALLGEFSSAIAHQIRNPLSNILMGSELLREALAPESKENVEDSERYPANNTTPADPLSVIFNDLSEGIRNLNNVVTGLLNYTRSLKLNCSKQRIEDLLEDTLGMLQETLKDNRIEIERYFEPELPPLFLDAMLMGQVFQAVICNALEAMPDGGRLFLSCCFNHYRQGHALVSIGDSGKGVSTLEIEKIFRPLYTTKDTGVGLGLSLAHRIVEAHRGSIWACQNPCPHVFDGIHKRIWGAFSPPLKGVTIHILLPHGGTEKARGDTNQWESRH